ncbi:cobalt transporter CbiM [Terrisporobacter sp.]
MHIPDNYLSPKTCATLAVVSAPVVVHSAKKLKEEVKDKKEIVPLMALCSSLCFLIMMFNIPLPGGTTAHAVGGCLLAILLGPYAACIAVSICLVLQALLFGDGGILALGANIFNMAIIMPFSGYYIYKLCDKLIKKRGKIVGAAIGAYLSINIAALCAAVELGIQPIIAHDAFNHPLYNPYPLSISVPAMLGAHLAIIGIVESIFTVSVYKIITSSSSQVDTSDKKEDLSNTKLKRLGKIIVFLVVLCPIGLIASGTAWGEWGPEELVETLKSYGMSQYVPQGMKNGFSFNALLPDYTFKSMPAIVSYILCAVTAVIFFVIVYRIIFSKKLNRKG